MDPTATMGLAVNLPASIPEVTGVGGTEFNEGSGTYWSPSNGANWGSALSYIHEIAWNDTSSLGILAASGGGRSIFFPKPVWRFGLGVPSDSFYDVPDVSLSGSWNHDSYFYCTNCSFASRNPYLGPRLMVAHHQPLQYLQAF
jgi:subtilase family serine protease